MKIKRTAWHYKISNSGRERSNDNLCNYFWRLVGNILAFVGKVMAALALVVCLVFLGYFIISDPLVLIVVLFFVSSAVFPILAIWFMRKKLEKSLEMPYGNIVIAYIKAKKEKVCPLIEYI